jgi:hypothetical protein
MQTQASEVTGTSPIDLLSITDSEFRNFSTASFSTPDLNAESSGDVATDDDDLDDDLDEDEDEDDEDDDEEEEDATDEDDIEIGGPDTDLDDPALSPNKK